MIHYHGIPACRTNDEASRFLMRRHALVSFMQRSRDQLPIVAECCQSFCLDNGAFSVWKRGEALDVASYIRWCHEWHRHPGFDWALIPDVIEGTEEDNDALLADWPQDLPGVPVWHMHESIDRLVTLAHSWRVVALGSSGAWPSPGRGQWWSRMAEAMDVLCGRGNPPPCKLHGLRMMNPDVFEHLPLSSADSTNVTQSHGLLSRFGMYVPPSSSIRAAVLAERIEHHNSAAVWAGPPNGEATRHLPLFNGTAHEDQTA